MILTTYRSKGAASNRYVKRVHGQDFYRWCEQSAADLRYDVAQGTCTSEDLPDDIRQKCDEYRGSFYPCVWHLGD